MWMYVFKIRIREFCFPIDSSIIIWYSKIVCWFLTVQCPGCLAGQSCQEHHKIEVNAFYYWLGAASQATPRGHRHKHKLLDSSTPWPEPQHPCWVMTWSSWTITSAESNLKREDALLWCHRTRWLLKNLLKGLYMSLITTTHVWDTPCKGWPWQIKRGLESRSCKRKWRERD
jgi:hypothetical protein